LLTFITNRFVAKKLSLRISRLHFAEKAVQSRRRCVADDNS
jgi:hypothetical protein